jgi:hypothetical protein
VSAFNIKIVAAVLAAFAAGFGAANLPSALATPASADADLEKRTFMVSINEVKQNFVFADTFSGSYSKNVTLSDGTNRQIALTPMTRNGMQVIELKDSGGLTYMSLNGTTTNGNLMIQVIDQAASKAALKAQGWQ